MLHAPVAEFSQAAEGAMPVTAEAMQALVNFDVQNDAAKWTAAYPNFCHMNWALPIWQGI